MNRRIASGVLNAAYALLGEPVRRSLAEFERTQWLSPSDLEEHRLGRLRQVLAAAHRESPRYRDLMDAAGIHPERVAGVDVLARLPSLSRDDLRASGTQGIGAPARGRREVRRTSGSTGVPVVLQKSRATTGAMNGLMWRNYGWYGIRMGDPQARIWLEPAAPAGRLVSRARDALQNRVRLPALSLGPRDFERFIDRLFSFAPRYLYGYGQSLYRLAEHASRQGRDLRPLGVAAVISTSETVTAPQRERISRVFDAPFANEYGCTEAGVIAFECPEGSLHLMDDALAVEIVRDDGSPAKPGEDGEILLTELYGDVAPLIRYRIADRGALASTPCPCGRSLRRLERFGGRVSALLRCPDGTYIDPDFLDRLLKSRPEMYRAVRQWRTEQEGPASVRATLCTEDGKPRPDIESYLSQELRKLTKGQLDMAFEYEEWLQPRASGKTL